MADLNIRVGELRFTARWEEAAPRTRAALEPWLPIHAQLIHCKWSGESTWIPFGDKRPPVGYENHNAHPAPGEILISYETYALVRDQIVCKKFGDITVKGVSHPVETYQVVDLYESLGREREVIHDEFANYSLTIKLEALSADERSRAVASLSRALEKLDQREDIAVKTAA